MLKKNSEAWKLALKIAKRKYTNWAPVALSEDGATVTVASLIRGNTWNYSLTDLRDRAHCGVKSC